MTDRNERDVSQRGNAQLGNAQRGSALIEIIGIGGVLVIVLVPTLLTAGRLQAANEAAHEVAQVAALTAARTGDAETATAHGSALLPEAHVSAFRQGDVVTVTVAMEVDLVAIRWLSHQKR